MGIRQHPLKLGILASGNGSNLQAIIDNCINGKLDALISVVISDNPEAYALKRAEKHSIPFVCIERKNFKSKDDFEHMIAKELEKHDVDLVCLAGYMRIVGPVLLEKYRGNMINIHPALLPSFKGLDAQKQALEYGVKISGCTVHYVDEKTDHGPIIAQAAVEVLENDTEKTLAARILEQEHKIYSYAIGLISEGRISFDGRKVHIKEPLGEK